MGESGTVMLGRGFRDIRLGQPGRDGSCREVGCCLVGECGTASRHLQQKPPSSSPRVGGADQLNRVSAASADKMPHLPEVY